MTLKVSVSIVTYEEEDYIRQTLDSVLSQKTDFPFEIIVGDDASNDSTPSILKEYQQKYPDNITLLLADKNYGDYGLSNFMATVKKCRGEYIAFLDGDDYWTDVNKLQKQVDFLDAHPKCSFSSHRIVHQSTNGHNEVSSRPKPGTQIYQIDSLIKSNFAHKISTVARRMAVDNIPAWYSTTKIASADWVFNLLLAKDGEIGFIDETMAVHRKRDGNLSAMYGQKRILQDRLVTLDLLSDIFKDHQSSVRYAKYKTKVKVVIASLSPRFYHILQRLFCYPRSKTIRETS